MWIIHYADYYHEVWGISYLKKKKNVRYNFEWCFKV